MTKIFCSQCRHSRYVEVTGLGKRLHCALDNALNIRNTLPTNSTRATDCLEFNPESVHDALKNRASYRVVMRKCGININDEQNGIIVPKTRT